MRKFGLIGKSLEHSWSKEYFRQKFILENITDHSYENFRLDNLSGLRDLILHENELAGLNVTFPFKLEIIDHLDELSPVAASIGAVNCVRISRTGNTLFLKGFNTDMQAFRDSIKPLLRPGDRQALVLGTGGAARAVGHALGELEIEFSFVSRKKKSGMLDYEGLTEEIMAEHPIIINATPIGMLPHQCPALPYKCLGSNHLLYDLIYNPSETLFLRKGAEAGARIKNGLEMLQKQAELSWQIWN